MKNYKINGKSLQVGRDVFEIKDVVAIKKSTPYYLDYQIEVMQAFRDGGKIEFYDDRAWCLLNKPTWSWGNSNYRIVLKPKYEQIKAKWVDENAAKICVIIEDRFYEGEDENETEMSFQGLELVPEPTYRPYTFEDFCRLEMYGKAIRQIEDNQIGYLRHDALGIYPIVINFEHGLRCISYEELKDEYTFLDGSPCGVKI